MVEYEVMFHTAYQLLIDDLLLLVASPRPFQIFQFAGHIGQCLNPPAEIAHEIHVAHEIAMAGKSPVNGGF